MTHIVELPYIGELRYIVVAPDGRYLSNNAWWALQEHAQVYRTKAEADQAARLAPHVPGYRGVAYSQPVYVKV